jgi:hypothetical protein
MCVPNDTLASWSFGEGSAGRPKTQKSRTRAVYCCCATVSGCCRRRSSTSPYTDSMRRTPGRRSTNRVVPAIGRVVLDSTGLKGSRSGRSDTDAFRRLGPPRRRILDNLYGFPEPCSHLGLQPSSKHVAGSRVKDSASSSSRSSTTSTTPPACPSCRSTDAVTTATRPDADSYWRCTKCGEVWNVARSQTDRYGAHRWP